MLTCIIMLHWHPVLNKKTHPVSGVVVSLPAIEEAEVKVACNIMMKDFL